MRPLKKELGQVDERLAALAAERASLESELSSGSLAATRLAEHGRRLKAIGDEIETLEMRWLELSEQIERLSA